MFLRQRYKLLALKKVPRDSKGILKLHATVRSVEFSDDGDEGQFYEEEEMASKKITVQDAQDIAQFVTEIDMEQEKGVEALYHILSIIQKGGSSEEAVAYCVQSLTPKKKPKKKVTK